LKFTDYMNLSSETELEELNIMNIEGLVAEIRKACNMIVESLANSICRKPVI